MVTFVFTYWLLIIYFHFLVILLKGAKRIVSEWADLDFEARRFTAKILGEDVDPLEQVTSPSQTQNSDSTVASEDKAEL